MTASDGCRTQEEIRVRRIGRCRLAVAVAALGIWVAHVSPAAAGVCVPLFHPVARSAQPLMDPEWLAPGDFTGDGRSDLAFSRVVAFEQPGTTAIGVLAGHGSGIFGPPVAEL